jgi:hypothetical protein
MHAPALNVVQLSRYWFPLQVSAPLVEQSRAEHALLEQLLQPFPCVIAHDMQLPIFEVVHPDRYWLASQVAAPATTQLRLKQAVAEHFSQPAP